MKRALVPYLRVLFTASVFLALALTGVCGDGSPAVAAATPTLNFSINQTASVVIGQADFTSGSPNRGGPVAANTIVGPFGNPVVYNGRLYLSDYTNTRVLGFNTIPTANGASADFVLGQANLTSANIPLIPTASNMSGPQTLQVDGGKLFLVDYDFNRLTIYNSVPTAGTANPGTADLFVGQPDLATADDGTLPTAANLIIPESAAVAAGKLIVTDSGNNRVLIWDPVPTADNTPASLVLGQPDFTSNAANNDPTTIGTPSARTLSNPTGVWSDGIRLVVTDSDNNRVLIWNSFPTGNQTAADVVLGQVDFAHNATNDDGTGVVGAPTAKTLSGPYAVFSQDGQLFIADQLNNRVLIWNSFPTLNQSPADVVLGQVDFAHNAANDDGTGVTGTPTATRLSAPSGLYVNGTQLFVADGGNNRYLIFDNAPTWTIAASAGLGGSVTPAGNTVVNNGSSQSYSIVTNAGYIIQSVLVDGVDKGTPSSWNFTNVTGNHTLVANFAVDPSTVSGNGTIRLVWADCDQYPGNKPAAADSATWTIRSGGLTGPVVASGHSASSNWSGINDIVVPAGSVGYYVQVDWYWAEESWDDETIFSSVQVTADGQIVRLSY